MIWGSSHSAMTYRCHVGCSVRREQKTMRRFTWLTFCGVTCHPQPLRSQPSASLVNHLIHSLADAGEETPTRSEEDRGRHDVIWSLISSFGKGNAPISMLMLPWQQRWMWSGLLQPGWFRAQTAWNEAIVSAAGSSCADGARRSGTASSMSSTRTPWFLPLIAPIELFFFFLHVYI